ncbi:hypothetical protein B566_EDAN009477 [Ephemera danica]|nr:hypothetical protein B566_EDAN009477 [Ephemera danica]
MMRLKYALLFLAAIVICVSSDSNSPKQNSKSSSAISDCDENEYEGVTKCCDAPKLLPYEYSAPCIEKCANKEDFKACHVECTLKDASWFINRKFKYDEMVDEFVFVASNSWTEPIKTACENCYKILPDEKDVKLTKNKFDPRPAKFFNCVSTELHVNCPGPHKIKKNKRWCAEKREALRKCSPFSSNNENKNEHASRPNKAKNGAGSVNSARTSGRNRTRTQG